MPNKVYVNPETALTLRNTGGSAALTLTSLAANAGRQSAVLDLSASPRSPWYTFRPFLKFATNPVVNESLRFYVKARDSATGGKADNDDGDSDAAVSAEDKLKNLHYIGSLIVDEALSTPEFSASFGPIYIPERYIQVVVWNATADALSATAADHGIDVIPVPVEIQ